MKPEQINANELLHQFQLSDADLQLIRDFGSESQADVKKLIDDFYRWLENQIWYNQYFSQGVPPQVQSLQRDYWQGFLKAQVDDEYVKQRVTVGRVHATINLPVSAYLAAMSFAQNWLSNLAKAIISDSEKCIRLIVVINKLIQLDSNIVMHVYALQSMEAVRLQGELTNRIVNEATRVVRSAATGNFDVCYESQDDSDTLEKPINRMINNLKRFNEENEKERWLKSGVADLALAMRGGLSIDELCDNVIRFLANYLNAQVGVFYVVEEDNTANLYASYAYTRRKNLDNAIQPGEGLVGQALKEKKSILLSQVPEDYITINSGLGEHVPRNVLVQPLLYEKSVKGIIELGSFNDFNNFHMEFLEQICESIAVAINSAQGQEKMRQLLTEAQETSEKMQYQQEELEAANQTLEEQAQALKQSEEELTTQRDMLEESNKELQDKTRDLERQKSEVEQARSELQQKADQLANSSKYKSEFLANMSHELRTPLNSLLLLSQTLIANKEGNLNEEQIEDLRVIYGGGSALLSLINDILDLSKVEAGKMRTARDTVNLEQLAKKMYQQFNPIAKDKKLLFNIDIDKGILNETLTTDLQRLEQILRNLLSNAFKFTHNGSVYLNIYKPSPDTQFNASSLIADQCLAFSVSDTGIGISEKNHSAIFEAFQQADGSTSRAYGGTGLGLTISRELAQLLGGEVQLQSQVAEGSTFTFYIPLQHTPAALSPPADSHFLSHLAHQLPSQLPSQLGSTSSSINQSTNASSSLQQESAASTSIEKYVLIVEDDEDFGKILAKLAENHGFKPLLVDKGMEALKLVLSHSPVAVILDMGLPDTDGLTVLESLKASPHTRGIPVHIVSAKDKDVEALNKGALGFLTKPVQVEDLEKVFAKFEAIIQKNIKQILLVEDDKSTSDFISHFLQDKGIQIFPSESGKQAIELLQHQRIDCCILDMSLADMNGFEFLSAVEKDPKLTMPPIVVYTARDLTEDDYKKLRAYTDKIVIKSGNSPERLQDEVELFLHSVDEKLPPTLRNQPNHHNSKDLQGRKVLLVDDDLRNVYALSRVLKEQGLVVVLADNGQLAVEKLQSEKDIDLVLMDIMMPVMDGYEAMQEIRANISSTIPIIALTAKAMASDRDKCIQAGANDYMSKPVDVENLLSMVKVWCYH